MPPRASEGTSNSSPEAEWPALRSWLQLSGSFEPISIARFCRVDGQIGASSCSAVTRPSANRPCQAYSAWGCRPASPSHSGRPRRCRRWRRRGWWLWSGVWFTIEGICYRYRSRDLAGAAGWPTPDAHPDQATPKHQSWSSECLTRPTPPNEVLADSSDHGRGSRSR
jgi:hypothetical protein